MLEKDIENLVLEWLSWKGIFAWKNQSVGVYDSRKKVYRKSKNKYHINGVSDILGILPDGKHLAIEIKTPQRKNTTSDDQQLFIDSINAFNGIGFVAWTLDMVIERLEKEGY